MDTNLQLTPTHTLQYATERAKSIKDFVHLIITVCTLCTKTKVSLCVFFSFSYPHNRARASVIIIIKTKAETTPGGCEDPMNLDCIISLESHRLCRAHLCQKP